METYCRPSYTLGRLCDQRFQHSKSLSSPVRVLLYRPLSARIARQYSAKMLGITPVPYAAMWIDTASFWAGATRRDGSSALATLLSLN